MVERHILVINPNTTATMTDKIGVAARGVAQPTTRISTANPNRGPSAIQGAADGEAALPEVIKLFEERLSEDQTIAAVIIACFDDVGVRQLKGRAPIPVIGIGEAAYHAASLIADRFSVVTTLSASIPVLEKNLLEIGFADRCVKVRASEVPVLELEDPNSSGRERIEKEIASALEEDDIGAVVLGCAGMADLALDLSASFGVPVIDGVAVATKFTEALLSIDLLGD